MAKEKNYLIIERTLSALTPVKVGNEYILEGIFAEIGVLNKNRRKYSAEQYVPWIAKLQEKIEKAKLLGELDHPKVYDITLANVSHVIEKLEYNPDTKQVSGKIRILDTSKGREAKALLDGGIPLHISSRAAGKVDEQGNVFIQQLFTYDLVADPGFECAELKRVNESFGFDESDENIFIYEMNNETEKIENKVTMENANLVTIEDFSKYSNFTKEYIEKIEKKLDEMTVTSTEDPKIGQLVEYTKEMASNVNKLFEYVNYLSTTTNKTLNDFVTHNDHIVENVKNLGNYVELVVEKTNTGFETLTMISEKLDNSITLNDSNSKIMNYAIEYMTMIAETTDKSIQYTESQVEIFDKAVQYIEEHVVENLKHQIGYTEMLKENIENIGNYANLVVEKINESINENKFIENENKEVKEITQTTPIVESAQVVENTLVDTIEEANKKLSDTLDALVESAKAEKEAKEDKSLNFLNFLSTTKRNEFDSLLESKKEEVVETFKTKQFFTTREVDAIYESIFVPKIEKLNFIDLMPEKFKEKWQNLSESVQDTIKSQAKYHPLNTQYQIDYFWSTRDLRERKQVLEPLNEEKKPEIIEEKKIISNERLSQISQLLHEKFNR